MVVEVPPNRSLLRGLGVRVGVEATCCRFWVGGQVPEHPRGELHPLCFLVLESPQPPLLVNHQLLVASRR